MSRVNSPVRMCISCRLRFAQKELVRLQWDGSGIKEFCGVGRSFYLCKDCVIQPKTAIFLCKKGKIPNQYEQNITQKLKEICING